MNYLKIFARAAGITLLTLLILTLITTLFSYFNILKEGATNIMKMITPLVSLFIGGFTLGKRASKKGWLEGIKLGATISIVIIIVNYLAFAGSVELKNLLYYLILMIACVFGSMIGINKAPKKES